MAKISSEKSRLSEIVSVVTHQLKNPSSVLREYIKALISEDFRRINQKKRVS